MENTTKYNFFNNFHNNAFSTRDFAFQAINLLVSSYILVASLVYQIRTERKKTKSKENKFLNILCVFNVLCAFVCVVKDLPVLYMENKPGELCLMVNYAGGVPYVLGLLTAFGMLWYRQYKLYSSPVLKPFNGFKAVNWILLIGYVTLVFSVTAVFLFDSDWVPVNGTCVQVFEGSIDMNAMLVSYCALTVFCQMLLFLFIAHPIVYRRKINKKVSANLKAMVKRLLICALGCCVSSLQLNVFLMLVTNDHVYLYWPNFAGLDLIITALCVIGTFANWRERIFPFGSNGEDESVAERSAMTRDENIAAV